jgi:penicillin-binding protein 1C
MESANWFVLTPAQEYYYRRQHAEYRMMPEFRPDCATSENAEAGRRPLDFLYPDQGARIYIPIDLAEKKSRTVFEAVHRDRNSVIHWHLDEQYLGSTRTFHQLALDATPGTHTITIVDQKGNRLARNFEVLAEEHP